VAAECRLAAIRGEDSPEAIVGAMLETDTFALIRAFLTQK
jgi:hypothetical protein